MVMKEEENVIHSCDGVVLAAEGSIHICAGKLILTETTLVVEEDFFDLVARTSIPIETIKVCFLFVCLFVCFCLLLLLLLFVVCLFCCLLYWC